MFFAARKSLFGLTLDSTTDTLYLNWKPKKHSHISVCEHGDGPHPPMLQTLLCWAPSLSSTHVAWLHPLLHCHTRPPEMHEVRHQYHIIHNTMQSCYATLDWWLVCEWMRTHSNVSVLCTPTITTDCQIFVLYINLLDNYPSSFI